MATARERFKMPDGSVYIVRRPAAETDGESVEMEFVLPPGCVPPPPNIHPQQVEEYEVMEGRFDVVVEGEWRTLAPGESASVPIGALHTFRNRSGGVVRVRNWHRPAIRFEDFIERTYHTLQQRALSESAIRASLSISRWSCWISTTRSSQGEGGSGFRCRCLRASGGCFPPRLPEAQPAPAFGRSAKSSSRGDRQC